VSLLHRAAIPKATTLAMLLLSFSSGLHAESEPLQFEMLPPLPQPVTNNAVALLPDGQGFQLYSALGLEAGKTERDTSSKAFHYSSHTGYWKRLQPVPGPGGRLAASAVVVDGQAYVFGGYTVARDGSEKSTPSVYRLDHEAGQWQLFTDMPVPVEDSVVLVYQDRYVYLVSGWHDLGNVNLVQVLDTRSGQWSQATPYPGAPVFGHSGGIADDRFIICDGVRIEYTGDDSPRRFLPATECWQGKIAADNYRRIDWRAVDSHPGQSRYRMAAGGDDQGRVFFAGGSVNPYNFNGIGYDGVPSRPEDEVFSYDFEATAWQCHGSLPVATMDHRGLPWRDGWFYIIGGMRNAQRVSAEVFKFKPAPAQTCRAETQQTSAPDP
jgi:N-acetylneuraminic acid mutarotase